MDIFWHNIRLIVFFISPIMNLIALGLWRRYDYRRGACNRNEKEKKSGRIWLIILLVMFNSVPIYLILDQLNRYVP